jgi:hypothetical protein
MGFHVIPSGKHTNNYGKSPFFMGKSTTVSLWPFSIAMFVYQRVAIENGHRDSGFTQL